MSASDSGVSESLNRFYGNNFAPIYVYAPPYASWSAGIRVLHYLCHTLNQLERPAWLALHGPRLRGRPDLSPKLHTPTLSKEILREHRLSGKPSIAIYPESIRGNPLNADVTVRWLLNDPGLLGGDVEFDDTFVLSYSAYIAKQFLSKSGMATPTLFLPAFDIREIDEVKSSINEPVNRSGRLLYAQKFRALGGLPSSKFSDALEILRFGRSAPTRNALLAMIASSEEIVVYENSTVISEAQLLGTPVRCVANAWFSELIAGAELGQDGVYWDPVDEDRMSRPDPRVTRDRYLSQLDRVSTALPGLVDEWSSRSLGTGNALAKVVRLPSRQFVSRHSISRARSFLAQGRIRDLIRFGSRYLSRHLNTGRHAN